MGQKASSKINMFSMFSKCYRAREEPAEFQLLSVGGFPGSPAHLSDVSDSQGSSSGTLSASSRNAQRFISLPAVSQIDFAAFVTQSNVVTSCDQNAFTE
jgi:hypothetical protein